MDYEKMAEEFLQKMFLFRKFKPHQQISESVHGEAFALQYITLHEDNVIPSEISEVMSISAARIAATLNSLENKGYITRKIDVNDRRRILIGLTSKGREQSEKYRKMIVEIAEKMLRLLGEHDAKEYIRITGKLAELAQNSE